MASERYAATGLQSAIAVSPGKTALGLVSAASIRPMIYFLDVSVDGTPSDVMIRMQGRRYTAAGTATAVTPVQLDPSGSATGARGTANANHTIEPTYTAASSLFDVDRHFRAPYQFQAVDQLAGLTAPAIAANGIGIIGFHASATPGLNATMHWVE